MGMGKRKVRFLEEVREWDCPFSCMQITWLCVATKWRTRGQRWDVLLRCVGRRRGLKVNPAKRKVMVLNGEDGLECEVSVNGV